MGKKKSEKAGKAPAKGAAKGRGGVEEELKAGEGGDARGLVDMNEAIRLLKTTRATFYRWLRSGKIRGMKVGRQWRFYREEDERFLKGEEPRIELAADITPLIEELSERLEGLGVNIEMGGDVPAVRQAVVLMVLLGRARRASDIHVTSHVVSGKSEPVTTLRYRIDGLLYEETTIDNRLLPAVVEEWKRMAGCDVGEKSKSQDGRIIMNAAEFTGAEEEDLVDVRVNFLPASLGESVTARLLDSKGISFVLDQIPFSPSDRERIDRGLRNPWGLILTTGPTGSGKTTTMYSCLMELAHPGVKIVTVEDPVEYNLPWATQVSVNADKGVSYGSTLRAILRTAPDIIMVGEIRDLETLEVAQRAGLTGYLVFSQLHTSNTADTLLRMVYVGSDPFMIVESTKLIIAQRLVRRLCPDCSKPDSPDANRLDLVADAARRGGLSWESLDRHFRKAVGCAKCGETGYRGRTVVAETMEMSGEIERALRSGASADEMQTIAVGQGMTTMAADGVRRAAAGETSLDEVMRVCAEGFERTG